MEGNTAVETVKALGGFVFANWEIFLGMLAIFFLAKFAKMGLGVLRTLVIVYVLFVIYKYQDYDLIKSQLTSDYERVNEKLTPVKSYVENNVTSKLKADDKEALDRLISETKGIVGSSFGTTEKLINMERERMKNEQ